MTHIIPEGTSEPQDFELRNDGEAVDGTGFDVTLYICQNVVSGEPICPEGEPPPEITVAWLSQANGTVRVTGVEFLEVGQYLVRFRLTDDNNQDGFFPNGAKADIWRVVPVPAR
jgi:hypothetical protein